MEEHIADFIRGKIYIKYKVKYKMKKNIIHLNENHLRRMITESVRRVMKEYYDYDSYLAHLEAENEPKDEVIQDAREWLDENTNTVEDVEDFLYFLSENYPKKFAQIKNYLLTTYDNEVKNYFMQPDYDDDYREVISKAKDKVVALAFELAQTEGLSELVSNFFSFHAFDYMIEEYTGLKVYHDSTPSDNCKPGESDY